ncbi:endo alpha-1,4 polygalactosaminidase [Candidatus Calescamantes bacterium]|nr:endo alpha-1,4 polygalactosaminidase [Candidatus Calescamantes bacterium]
MGLMMPSGLSKIGKISELALFFLLVPAISHSHNISNFAVYYGKDSIARLSQYDLVILQSYNFTPQEIKEIKKKGTKVLLYLSIGETPVLEKGRGNGPGGYAGWYLDKNGDDFPDKSLTWNTYYVNPGNKEWRKKILEEKIPALLQKGADGVFLDNLDTVDIYPTIKQGFITLIREIRRKFPQIFIVVNRGFTIVEEIAPYIDGVLFECFTTHYDFLTKSYKIWEGEDLKWAEEVGRLLQKLKDKYGFIVFTLDYALKEDKALRDYILQRARKFGFIPYISTLHLLEIP